MEMIMQRGAADDDAPEAANASTTGAAEDYARREFGIDADYGKYTVEMANAVNKEISDMRDAFGKDCFEGALHKIGTFPKGYDTRVKGVFEWHPKTSTGNLWLRNVSVENALDKLKADAMSQKATGFWSTGEATHVIRHELGHAMAKSMVQRGIAGSVFTDIRAIFDGIVGDVMKARGGTRMYARYLSRRGLEDMSEFVSESVAEYMAGSPRETAMSVVELLLNTLRGGS
jgi:hypothetical protein